MGTLDSVAVLVQRNIYTYFVWCNPAIIVVVCFWGYSFGGRVRAVRSALSRCLAYCGSGMGFVSDYFKLDHFIA